VYALSVIICGNWAGGVYLAAVPAYAVHTVLTSPGGWRRLLSWRLWAVLAGVALAAGAYLAAVAGTSTRLDVRWAEVGYAVYFLAALYILLRWLDRLVWLGLGKALAKVSRGAGWAGRAGVALRLAVLVAVGGPLVASALMTHWVRFAETSDPRQLTGADYAPAAFLAADGTEIRGWHMPCPDPASDASVILAPGRNMGKSTMVPVATRLNLAGYSVLIIDLRGEGASGGHSRGLGATESQDVIGAVNYLRWAHPRQSRHIFAMGILQGATAVLAAAAGDARIEAIVADSPLPGPQDELKEVAGALPGPLGDYFRQATLSLASFQAGYDLSSKSASRCIGQIGPRPVLLIYGQDDALVQREAIGQMLAQARPSMLWRAPQAGHGEALLRHGDEYCDIMRKLFASVECHLPPFEWAQTASPS
jgi:pimeloyl-ACP methyl ester carboxylesterase